MQAVLKVNFLDLDEMLESSRVLDLKLKLWEGMQSWSGCVEDWGSMMFSTLDIESLQVSE